MYGGYTVRERSTDLLEASASSLPLSDLRDQYIHGHLTRKDFEGRVFQTLLDGYQRFNLFNYDKEMFIDYLCWLYPRLSQAIDIYKELGSSFDAYIGSFIRLGAKEYRLAECTHHVSEQACWEACTEEPYEEDATPEYDVPEVFKPVNNPRQALILLLKSYWFVPEDFVPRVVPALGMNVKRLTGLLDKVRELRFARDDAIHKMREQMYSYFYRSAAYRNQLEALPESSPRRATLQRREEKAWARYSGLRQRLSGVNRQASNRQVAEVLGIPKGTVDSALSAIKRKVKL
jgi:hypothetical protein